MTLFVHFSNFLALQKKKFNDENLGCGTVRSDMYRQMCNAGDCRFLGLNIGDNLNIINQENQGLGTKTPLVPQMGYAVGNGKQVIFINPAQYTKT